MKRDFIKFAPTAKAYLPKTNIRRFPGCIRAAYKSDGGEEKGEEGGEDKKEIKTSSDLLKSLNEMKAGLEAKAKADVKAEVTEQLKAVQAAIDEIKNIKPEVTAEELKQIKADLAVTIRAFDLLQTRVKNAKANPETEVKSFNDRIKEAVEENTDAILKFSRKETKSLTIEIKAVGAVSTGNVTGTTHWGAQMRPGIIENPNTLTQMRDLLAVYPAGPGTDFYFMRENGVGEGSIAPVAENATKPQFDLDLVESSVKFETIAGWMLMSRKAMLNIPNFMAFLQRRLPQKLMDVESQQILYGTGTSPEIKGILVAGNFVASTSAIGNPLIEKIIDDITLLEDVHKRMATGIALRPAQFNSFFKNKATGSGEYDLPQGVTFVNGKLYILGVPVVKTTALNLPDYVVGDFVDGSELWVQEAMSLKFFEQDGTNVRTNQITARIEETVALPVYGSNFFVKGTSATS